MATHIKHSSKESTARFPEWFEVGATIGRLANQISGRYDLVGLVSPDAGSGAPACYKPQISEIEVNTEVAFGKGATPESIGDLTLRATQYEFPVATGAIMHEAFHAKFSAWDLESAYNALKRDEYEALVLLEEGRIEAQGVALNERYRVFLRASAMAIVLGDTSEMSGSSVENFTTLVGLLHSRIISGILNEEDVQDALDQIEDALGSDVISQLVEIMTQYQAHTNHSDVSDVYPLAIEWARIVRELKEQHGENTEAGSSESSEAGESSDGSSSEESEAFAKALKEIIESLEDAKDEISISNAEELADQEQSEDWKEEVSERENATKEKAKHKKVASEIFSKGTAELATTGSSSRLMETRQPTSAERASAVVVARLLEKAKYRDRDLTEVTSILPPGRLRTKALVQGKALESRGIRTAVEPWRKTVRKQTEDPTLTVGVMVDISGSMGSAMNPMATTAWVMSEAVRRVQGRCAMVYYGSGVFSTLKAGQHLTEVNVYTAPDGTEKFDKAFQAIDGELNLLNGSGARLLVIVSDGEYTSEQSRACRQWMKRCEQAGVAVIWMPFDNGYSVQRLLDKTNISILKGKFDPTEASTKIGEACAKALTAIGRRNS